MWGKGEERKGNTAHVIKVSYMCVCKCHKKPIASYN
jgi:hypothetical protein